MINNRLESLNLLRGIAVVAVCFCHFGDALSAGHLFAYVFQMFHDYGKYGVQIFFVISGFVIPLSLFKSRYSSGAYGRFLLKRLARLHPPYLVALAMTLLIGYASCRARNVVFPETVESIVLSSFYGHVSEINPVFWTLVVEAQYYIFIGMAYVWLIKYPKSSLLVVMPTLLLLGQSFVAEYIRIFAFINYFLIGWIGFLIYTKQAAVKAHYAGLVALLIFTFTFNELSAGVAALLTIGVILFYNRDIPPVLTFPGNISYSLYLIHFPIGIKFINLAARFVSPNASWILFPLALALTFALAWLFWKYIESPWAGYSVSIKYRP